MSRALVAVALLACVTSCAGVEKERGHDTVSKLVQRRTGFETGWQRGTPAERQIAERVAKLLEGGLSRARAVQIALLNSPKLQETYEELDVSQADLVQAGLLSNPTLAGSVGFPTSGSYRTEYEVSLVQSFLDVFVLPLRKRIAKRQFMADTLRVAHAALETAADVSKEFAEVQAQEQLVSIMRLLVNAADAAASLAQSQYDAGNLSLRELAVERAFHEQAELDLARDELALLERREHLNRLLGLWGQKTSWRVAERLAALPASEPALEHLERTALRQRLDIDAARKQAELMASALSLAKTSRYTGPIEVGVHMHQDPDGPRLLGPTLSLELPIFDQRQALIARLEAEQRRARRRLDALAIDARSEVRLARAKLLLSRRTVERYRTVLLPTRETALEQSQLQYNAMQIGLYELLAAKKDQVETYRAYIESIRDYWIASAELERALGGKLVR